MSYLLHFYHFKFIPFIICHPPLPLQLLSLSGLSGANVLLYSFGFIVSVVVFPIGIVLWFLSCCKVFRKESDDSSYPHNSTSEFVCNRLN